MPDNVAIGFYIENYSPGGLERLLFDLLASIPKERYSPVLFYAGDKNFPERLNRGKSLPPPLVWVPVYTTKHIEEWVWSKQPPRWLWRVFLGVIDLVRWLYAGLNIARCRQVFAGHPVTTLHVVNGGYPAARSCLSAVVAARELKFGKVYMTVTATPQKRRWPILESYFDKRVEASCDGVISNCDYLTKVLRDLRDFSDSKTLTIYGGIPSLPAPTQDTVNTFCRTLSITRPLIGSVAVLQYHKGHRFLVEALGRLKREFPSFCCLIVGDGVERQKLQDLAKRMDLSQHVRFAGHLADFRTAMEAMDIFVHPSLEEGFPYVILEAMSLGKPIVATRIAGVPEQIVDGESGLLVEPGDSAALSRAIEELLKDPERARRLGRKAKDRARLFTAENMIQKFHQLF